MTTAFGLDINDVPSNLDTSGLNVYWAQRFTAEANLTLSGCYFRLRSNYNTTGLVGIQSNNAGVPDNVYITSGLFTVGSTTNMSFLTVGFSSQPSLTSGTIYHYVFQPTQPIGAGSTIRFVMGGSEIAERQGYSLSSVNTFKTTPDSNILKLKSTNSGGTWDTAEGTNYQPLNVRFFTTDSKHFFKPYAITTNTNVGGGSFAGMLYYAPDNIGVTGLFLNFATIGNNTGSVWFYCDYSGTQVAGVRPSLGSFLIGANGTMTSNSWNSTGLNLGLSGGSIYMLYIGAPQGNPAQTGSRLVFRRYGTNTGSILVGLGSLLQFDSNTGSNIVHNIGNTYPMYFALSGGGAVAPSYTYNLYGDNLVTYTQ